MDHTKNRQAVKRDVAFKSLDEKVVKSHLFSLLQAATFDFIILAFEGHTVFHSLAVFVLIQSTAVHTMMTIEDKIVLPNIFYAIECAYIRILIEHT